MAIARRGTWVLGLVAVLAAGCAEPGTAGGEQPSGCSCAPAAAVVDPALLAFLSRARAAHGEADLAESEGKPERAIAVLERLVAARAPWGAQPPPEVRETVADTLARLGEIRSAQGHFDRADHDIRQGLGLAVERTHYRGRLLEVLGVIEKRRHDRLREQGDEAGAERAKQRSIEAFQQAIAIQDEVIQAVLGDGGLPAVGDGGR